MSFALGVQFFLENNNKLNKHFIHVRLCHFSSLQHWYTSHEDCSLRLQQG